MAKTAPPTVRPRRKVEITDGFEFAASLYGVTVDAVVEIYKATIGTIKQEIDEGATNAPLGLGGQLKMADLLHGGAYAAPINQRPYYLATPNKSPYYAGDLKNLWGTGLAGFLATLGAGLNASNLADEILIDANVPHVFPKFLSDEVYAMIRVGYAQALTTDLFKTASTGVSTLVKSGVDAAERLAPLLKGANK